MKDIGARIIANAQQNLGKKGTVRSDLAFCDYTTNSDGTSAKVVIAYSKKMGVPSPVDIGKYIGSTFDGKLLPVLATGVVFEELNAVACTVELPQLTRPKADSENMAAVTASAFMDFVDQSLWQVKTNVTTGVSYLARAVADNIEDILSARKELAGSRNYMATASAAALTAVTGSYLNANEDDYVKFYDGNGVNQGVIKSVSSDNKILRIMSDEGDTFVVDRTAVTMVVRKDPAEQKQITEEMIGYYSKIWGKDFAEQMFKYGSVV